ncbi:MAG: hypothetical protein DMF70_16095 [Acidobacteria bacterium]|nr:MAG: hypothetical protein DMF70_16095 [Acidobacteriota bacterium]
MPATFSAMVDVFASAVERGCAEMLEAKSKKTPSEKMRRFIYFFLRFETAILPDVPRIEERPRWS